MSADICSEVTQTVGVDNGSVAKNAQGNNLQKAHENNIIANKTGMEIFIGSD